MTDTSLLDQRISEWYEVVNDFRHYLKDLSCGIDAKDRRLLNEALEFKKRYDND